MNGLQLFNIEKIIKEEYNAITLDRACFIPPYEYVIPKKELVTIKRFKANEYPVVKSFTPEDHILAVFTDTLLLNNTIFSVYIKGVYIHKNKIHPDKFGCIGLNSKKAFPYSYVTMALEMLYFKSMLVKQIRPEFVTISIQMSTFLDRGMYGLLLGILDLIAAGILEVDFLEYHIVTDEFTYSPSKFLEKHEKTI